jgi:hypothetical protein
MKRFSALPLNNTGVLQRNMITTSCTGTGCCSGYGYACN